MTNRNEAWSVPLKVHPLADAFPPLPDDEKRKLAESIAKNGLRQKIIIFEGMILDGRNRHQAAELLGIELDRDEHYVEFDGDFDAAVALVTDLNLRRRDLSFPQRLKAAAKLAELERGRPRKKPPRGGFSSATMKEVAKKLGVGERSIQRHRRVRESGSPELVEAVESGKVPPKVAEEMLKLDKTEQREALAGGEPAVKAAVHKARSQPPVRELSEVQKAVRQSKRAEAMFAEMARVLVTVKSLASGLAESGIQFSPNQRELGRDFGRQLVTTGEWVQSLFTTEVAGVTDANLAQLFNEDGN